MSSNNSSPTKCFVMLALALVATQLIATRCVADAGWHSARYECCCPENPSCPARCFICRRNDHRCFCNTCSCYAEDEPSVPAHTFNSRSLRTSRHISGRIPGHNLAPFGLAPLYLCCCGHNPACPAECIVCRRRDYQCYCNTCSCYADWPSNPASEPERPLSPMLSWEPVVRRMFHVSSECLLVLLQHLFVLRPVAGASKQLTTHQR